MNISNRSFLYRIIRLLFIIPLAGISQTSADLRFYPLAVGDLWQFHSTYRNSGNESKTYYTIEVIGDTVAGNDRRYMILHSTSPRVWNPRYQRIDSMTLQVMAYDTSNGGREVPLDSLATPTPPAGFIGYRRGEKGGFGYYRNDSSMFFGVKRISRWMVQPAGEGPSLHYWLTEHLGLTRISHVLVTSDQIPWVSYFDTLVYARINGIQYGTLVSVPQQSSQPVQFALEQNYPNPFNPSTTIRYHVAASGPVTLTVHDVLGREVAILVDRQHTAGDFEVNFSGEELSSGVYFCRLQAGTFTSTKKMFLLK